MSLSNAISIKSSYHCKLQSPPAAASIDCFHASENATLSLFNTGKNCSEQMGFKEQKKPFAILKP